MASSPVIDSSGLPDDASTVPARAQAPSTSDVLRLIGLVLLSAAACYLAWRVRLVVRLAGISLFLAFAMNPVVDALDRRSRVPRGLIILMLYVLLAIGVALIGALVIPSTVRELGALSHNAPTYARELREDAAFRHYDNRYHITATLVHDAARLPETLGHLVGPLKDVTVSAFSLVGQLVTVLALTFLLLLRGREYVGMGLALTGERSERLRGVVLDINQAVARYTLGNIVISVLATLATWIVLTILGVPYAISLGFVVGFFDLIPLVGATIGAIIVSLATLTVDFPVATIIWIAFIIVWQRFEDYIVQPVVYGKALHVDPIVVILAVLSGAALLGVLGALIAIPTAAAIQIIITDWWSWRSSRATAAEQRGGQSDPRRRAATQPQQSGDPPQP